MGAAPRQIEVDAGEATQMAREEMARAAATAAEVVAEAGPEATTDRRTMTAPTTDAPLSVEPDIAFAAPMLRTTDASHTPKDATNYKIATMTSSGNRKWTNSTKLKSLNRNKEN